MATKECEVDLTEWERSLWNTVATSKKPVADVVAQEVKKVVELTVQITPPGSENVKGAAARKQGEGAIKTDLLGGRRGIGRSGKRYGAFVVIGNDLLNKFGAVKPTGDFQRLWITKNGDVYGTQQHFYRPNASIGEMAAHHAQYFKDGRMSAAGAFTREIGRWKWIDQMIVSKSAMQAYLRFVYKKVGFLASGWVPALVGLGGSVPAWIGRHDAPGSIEINITDLSVEFIATNKVHYASNQQNMERRLQWAIDTRKEVMDRRLADLLQKQIEKLAA